jgi:tRNA A37 threonylcarbamoyladenosine dehydratase
METSMENLNLRFGGIARLYGVSGLKSLLDSSVMVIGLGGVGSWAVEALARSAIGTIILVDLDDVCITNTNRQICATSDTIGKSKVEVLRSRIKNINPDAKVISVENFFTAATLEEIFSLKVDYIIDAIDSMENKCILISEACKRNIPIITTGGAAGKIDPTQIKVDDIAFTTNDVFLQIMRKRLRRDFGFKKAVGHSLKSRRHMGVMCVYSPEDARYPTPEGGICHTPDPESNLILDCESGMGSATMVTGSFGFIAASFVVKEIAAIKID